MCCVCGEQLPCASMYVCCVTCPLGLWLGWDGDGRLLSSNCAYVNPG